MIGFGSLTLNNLQIFSRIILLSENEFIMMQMLSQSLTNISVSNTFGDDISMVRMTTDLKLKYNLMFDYENVESKVIDMHVHGNT